MTERDIVGRLRNDKTATGLARDRILEAADEIAFLRARVTEMEDERDAINKLADDALANAAHALRAENARLREALKPFAAWLHGWAQFEIAALDENASAAFSIKHVLAARAALSADAPAQEDPQ